MASCGGVSVCVTCSPPCRPTGVGAADHVAREEAAGTRVTEMGPEYASDPTTLLALEVNGKRSTWTTGSPPGHRAGDDPASADEVDREDRGDPMRAARIVLVVVGVLVMAFGAYVLVTTVRPNRIWGLRRGCSARSCCTTSCCRRSLSGRSGEDSCSVGPAGRSAPGCSSSCRPRWCSGACSPWWCSRRSPRSSTDRRTRPCCRSNYNRAVARRRGAGCSRSCGRTRGGRSSVPDDPRDHWLHRQPMASMSA